jgi:mannonate dehydratase
MLTIRDVRVILTNPQGQPLVIVKVETSEPGLYGLGCATFTQRYMAVKAAIEEHLRALVLGRDAARIEEIWQLMHVNGYWRNGAVLNNAMSGIDQALWDIKGKVAKMPVYDLLGGKVREAAAVYRHSDGKSLEEIAERVQKYVEMGVGHVRVQFGGYGGKGEIGGRPEGALAGAYYDTHKYMRGALRALEHVRGKFPELELVHDVHSRLVPAEAVGFAKECEPLKLFFLEDLLAPEDIEWFANVRALAATPLAMGELFNHPREWTPLIVNRQIDFMRMHISQMGGITPARKVAALGELHGVRTAWHGPADTSPVGHAANLHLDVATINFGIQEFGGFNDAVYEVFPGAPEQRGGYLYPNDKPGLGIDINEKAAAKYPNVNKVVEWTQTRRPDGSLTRP